MPKFNLYKILRNRKDDLIAKFGEVNLVMTNSTSLDGFDFEFYFSEKPDKVEIWWAELYKDFINQDSVPQNIIYFGALLIYNENLCYAVSLGKSHFYLKNFCDKDFGMNLAERIVDVNNLKIKNSKFKIFQE